MKLFENLREYGIPMNMLQYMPFEFDAIAPARARYGSPGAGDLRRHRRFMPDYEYATDDVRGQSHAAGDF